MPLHLLSEASVYFFYKEVSSSDFLVKVCFQGISSQNNVRNSLKIFFSFTSAKFQLSALLL